MSNLFRNVFLGFIRLLRYNNVNTRTIWKICSKLKLQDKDYINDVFEQIFTLGVSIADCAQVKFVSTHLKL